jgi:hypothetical protein
VKLADPLRPTAPAVSVFAPAVAPSVQLPTVAIPDAFVVVLAPVNDPAPLPMKKLTLAPLTGLLFASRTFTDGATVTAVPATAVCPSPALTMIEPGAPAVAVAVNVITRSAEPTDALIPRMPAIADAPLTVAVSVFCPATLPSLQLPTAATPDSLVVCDGPVIEPPPLVTANDTATFGIALPFASAILTDGGVATVDPTAVL